MLSEARRRGASNGNSSRCEAKRKDVEVLSSWQQMERSAAHMIGPSLDIDFHTSGSRQAFSTSQHRHRTLSGIMPAQSPIRSPQRAGRKRLIQPGGSQESQETDHPHDSQQPDDAQEGHEAALPAKADIHMLCLYSALLQRLENPAFSCLTGEKSNITSKQPAMTTQKSNRFLSR